MAVLAVLRAAPGTDRAQLIAETIDDALDMAGLYAVDAGGRVEVLFGVSLWELPAEGEEVSVLRRFPAAPVYFRLHPRDLAAEGIPTYPTGQPGHYEAQLLPGRSHPQTPDPLEDPDLPFELLAATRFVIVAGQPLPNPAYTGSGSEEEQG
ncbi:MAG: hypothetical protein ACRDZ3_05515 [Acidimicrobiia bacterium]